jgi:carboxyl-terminal processing protease
MIGFLILVSMLSLAEIETRQQALQKQLDLFGEFYALVDKNFVDTLDLPVLTKNTMNKLLKELDPYSTYYDSLETKRHNEAWKGILYAGIGSTVKQTDSGVALVEPSVNMPALQEGLRTGDVVLEINERNVQHLALDSVVHLLKGNADDTIALKLRRPYGKIFTKKFARKTIVSKAVPLYFLEKDGTGYILLAHFLEGSAKDFKEAMNDLKARGMKRLVLDLRNNTGGLVDECSSAISAFFPPKKVVCSLRLKDSTGNYSYYTGAPFIDTSMPLVVLTNRHTISSGEIFAGALKDYKRATLIGDRTYGKGFVQGTRFMKHGATVYLTVARYYTPSGYFIGAKGVAPDIAFTDGDSIPPDLQAVFNSGVIIDYSIKMRNTKGGEQPDFNVLSYNDFMAFYQSKISSVELPEEKVLKDLKNYKSVNALKAEILKRKQQLPILYKKEIELELRSELLKRYYQYIDAAQMNYEQSAIYKFMAEKKVFGN